MRAILFLFLSIITISVFGQKGNSAFFRKDLLFDNKVYKIKVSESLENGFHFDIERDNEKQSFTQFSINDNTIFHNNLGKAIGNLDKSIEKDIKLKEDSLIAVFELVLDSNRISGSKFVVKDDTKDEINWRLGELVNIAGCKRGYKNLKIIDTLLLYNNLDLAYLSENRDECVGNQESLSPKLYRDLLGISNKLIIEIRTAYTIDLPDDASLSGRINLKADSVVVRPLRVSIKKLIKLEINDPDWEGETTIDEKTRKEYLELANSDGLVSFKKIEKPKDQINELKKELFYLIIDSVQYEFERNRLQNIKVVGKIDGEVEIFENRYPIPFSTKSDLNLDAMLFSVRNIQYDAATISLKDIMYFDYNLSLGNENYSPADQVVSILPDSRNNILLKERTSEILSAEVFTDLVGISAEKPNGILQVEVGKEIILNSKPILVPKKGNYYFHALSSVNPYITISKIEDDDRILVPGKFDDTIVIRAIDLLQYRNYSLGIDLDVLRFSVPRFHSEFSFVGGINVGSISIENLDTIQNQNALGNSIDLDNSVSFNRNLTGEWYFGIDWHILPSNKYSLEFGYRLSNLKVLSDDRFDQIFAIDNLDDLPERESFSDSFDRSAEIHKFHFKATAKTSQKGELFFKAGYNFSKRQNRQNFSQVLVGYSYSIFGK